MYLSRSKQIPIDRIAQTLIRPGTLVHQLRRRYVSLILPAEIIVWRPTAHSRGRQATVLIRESIWTLWRRPSKVDRGAIANEDTQKEIEKSSAGDPTGRSSCDLPGVHCHARELQRVASSFSTRERRLERGHSSGRRRFASGAQIRPIRRYDRAASRGHVPRAFDTP